MPSSTVSSTVKSWKVNHKEFIVAEARKVGPVHTTHHTSTKNMKRALKRLRRIWEMHPNLTLPELCCSPFFDRDDIGTSMLMGNADFLDRVGESAKVLSDS